MSDILDNKSDAEIEEIYSRATIEDLQSMLTQEKCLNRRRLLRKVMRCKSSNPPEQTNLHKSDPKIITPSQQNNFIKPSKIDQDKPDPVQVNHEYIQRKLDEMRKQLSDTVDLTKRKELRKEIQELENNCGTQHKKIHVDPNSQKDNLSAAVHFDEGKKNNLFHHTEDPKPPLKELPMKINKENEPKLKTNKVSDLNQKPLNKEHSQTNNFSKEISNEDKSNKINTSSTNSKVVNKILDKTLSEISIKNNLAVSNQGKDDQKLQENLNITKECSSSQKEISNKIPPVHIISDTKNNISTTPLSVYEKKPQRNSPNFDSKPLMRSNTTYSPSPKLIPNQTKPDSSPTSMKNDISRVSSVREKFENPSIATKTVSKPTSSKMTEKEINDLVNAVLNPEKSDDHKLAVPNQPPRKISQPNIMAMIPQIKKVAKNVRSSIQVKKEQIIIFCQQNTQEYQNVSITNYSKSWADGLAFCALIHHFYPDSFDYKTLSSNNPVANFTLAFDTAKKCAGIEPLIDPEDMISLESPDEKCVYTYVQFMYNILKSHPRNMVKYVTNSEG